MKIKSLWVSEYKNIKDLKLEFKAELISLLVGKNGLGKSNVIEILALIFRDLDLQDSQEQFENWPYDPDHFEYEIHYECKKSEVRIECKESFFRVSTKIKGTLGEMNELEFQNFRINKKEELLPDYIIGYYSGENKRIKNILQPYINEVLKDLKRNRGLDKGLRNIFFAESFHGKMLLLTLLIYQSQNDDGEFQGKIKQLIERFCSFSELGEVSVELKQPSWYSRSSKSSRAVSIEILEENLLEKTPFPFWGSKGKADKIIDCLYNNSLKHLNYYDDENPIKEEHVERLELEEINLTAISEKVVAEFGHPANFFDALESLQLIDSLKNIQLQVRSRNRNVSFDFTGLSEGEQQLITVLGLILITGREDCLFLLDEPDTHLNPIWQREYVRLLKDFNLNDDNSHIVVATHSPFIVQAADDNIDIFLYRASANGEVVIDNNNDLKIHNWRIDQVLASEYFEFENTRPPQLDEFMREREELLAKPVLTDEDLKKLEKFQEEEELLPSGETLNDFLAMHLLRKTAAKENDKDK